MPTDTGHYRSEAKPSDEQTSSHGIAASWPSPASPRQRPVAAPRGRIFGSILDAIGGTPLVRLPNFIERDKLAADILLKLEYLNPLGSLKDRIGLAMVEDAERQGLIVPGQSQIVEPTSGNTGIALAFVAAAKEYSLVVVMPDSTSLEKERMLRLMGASIELTPAVLGMAGAIARAEEIVARSNHAWMPRQFDNPANPQFMRRRPRRNSG